MGCNMTRKASEGKEPSQAEVCGESVSARRKAEFTGAEAGKTQCAPRTARKSMRKGRGEPRGMGDEARMFQ